MVSSIVYLKLTFSYQYILKLIDFSNFHSNQAQYKAQLVTASI